MEVKVLEELRKQRAKGILYEPHTYKVLVTHPEVPQEALELLRSKCEVIVCESVPPDRKEILAKAKGVHGLLWASHQPLNAEILEAIGPQLKSISTMSSGFDFVDLREIENRQIALGHTSTVLDNAVADVAIGLMIAAARRFTEGRKKIESATCENCHHQWMLGQDIRYKKIGFYGFGGIGQAIAKRLAGFDIDRILYTARRRVDYEVEKKLYATKVHFPELLEESDFIFIAAPLTKQTKDAFDSEAFELMKKTAVLINISQGGIINHDHLYDALESGKIFAAGLDVTTPEPLPADHKLLTLPNCVILPHLGTATYKTRNDMAIMAATNVLQGLEGDPMIAPVIY